MTTTHVRWHQWRRRSNYIGNTSYFLIGRVEIIMSFWYRPDSSNACLDDISSHIEAISIRYNLIFVTTSTIRCWNDTWSIKRPTCNWYRYDRIPLLHHVGHSMSDRYPLHIVLKKGNAITADIKWYRYDAITLSVIDHYLSQIYFTSLSAKPR